MSRTGTIRAHLTAHAGDDTQGETVILSNTASGDMIACSGYPWDTGRAAAPE